jgi:hypothetical protein
LVIPGFHNLPLLEMTPAQKFVGDQDEDEHPQLAVPIKQIIFNGCTQQKILSDFAMSSDPSRSFRSDQASQ